MKVTKYYCDICGEEYDESHMPPWYPDLCPKHMEEYRRNTKSTDQVLYKYESNKSIKTWL